MYANIDESPLFWVVAGATTTSWWLRHPNSKLFWFVAGVGATSWFLNSPLKTRMLEGKERWRLRWEEKQRKRAERRARILAELGVETEVSITPWYSKALILMCALPIITQAPPSSVPAEQPIETVALMDEVEKLKKELGELRAQVQSHADDSSDKSFQFE